MNAGDIKEIVNTFFEGTLSLAVVIGSGLMINSHPDSTTVVGVAAGAGMAVITFWFGQRGQVKAVNGNIGAIADIARQMTTTAAPASPSRPVPSE